MLESGTPIIPVFYHVKPSDLKRTPGEGVYATSLWQLAKKKDSSGQPRYDSTTIEKWINALRQVADISGLDVQAFNGDEGELVDKVVEYVLRCVKPEAVELAEVDASTSADFNNDYRCDVFISHRGPDVRRTFASYLYRSLIGKGLRVFLEDERLKACINISSKTEGAIRSASVHIAIFSPNYAESHWCLDELVFMLESGAPIIPVYHYVLPSELRWTQRDGLFARSLQCLAHKTDFSGQPRYDSTTIEKWRNALAQVADITGFELSAFNG